MRDAELVRFLQWALPRMGMRWPGFRKVRGQVRKRLQRRLAELGLADLDHYRAHLEGHTDEWDRLDAMTRITISRFHRDRRIFARVGGEVLPRLARRAAEHGEPALRVWSAGCANGEEPHTVSLWWHLGLDEADRAGVALDVLATDADRHLLERARRACYPAGALKELPEDWVEEAFEARGDERCLRRAFRAPVRFAAHDVREPPPERGFHLVLCRNLVLTYFDQDLQRRVLARMLRALVPGGAFVTGGSEQLPEGASGLEDWDDARAIYRRAENLEERPTGM